MISVEFRLRLSGNIRPQTRSLLVVIMLVNVALCLLCVGFSLAATTTSSPGNGGNHGLPTGAALTKIVQDSFRNVDSDGDGFIERNEFDTLVIIADADNDGCMTLSEYITFSAGTPEIATKIYHYFDIDNTNCLTVDKVADQFQLMDADHNKKLLQHLFQAPHVATDGPIG
ncbi:hypothetical protein MAR_034221 [Mya arenaria]|uniref:EF-hand domain-containing protein n=1 Tax=Mya arenaria TaxID=6604 RepID=A0ABY7GDR8_MYAAR|nr:hypothetical protein MAR_034221 [Mya arenaria]